MHATLFGQFLVDKSIVSEDQLAFALGEQCKNNLLLGELAVSLGMLDVSCADEINQRQSAEDKLFGDIAIELGYLTEQQMDKLLFKQRGQYKHVGEILVDNQIIQSDELKSALQAHQSITAQATRELEQKTKVHPLKDIFDMAIDFNNKLFLRTLKSRCQIRGLITPCDVGVMTLNTVHITVSGERAFTIAMACDDDTTINIASAFMGLDRRECTIELSVDAIGEYLNIMLGYILNTLRSEEVCCERMEQSMGLTMSDLIESREQALLVELNSQLGGVVILVSL